MQRLWKLHLPIPAILKRCLSSPLFAHPLTLLSQIVYSHGWNSKFIFTRFGKSWKINCIIDPCTFSAMRYIVTVYTARLLFCKINYVNLFMYSVYLLSVDTALKHVSLSCTRFTKCIKKFIHSQLNKSAEKGPTTSLKTAFNHLFAART